MGALSERLKTRVNEIMHVEWTTTDGRVVPTSDKIANKNTAIKLDATILYADLAESTALVDGHKWWFAGEIYKCYLECASRIINDSEADIVAYDGDRVMAIYLGEQKENRSVRAALKINGAVSSIINPRIEEVFKDKVTYRVKHGVGIDTSEIYAAKVGVRGDTDIVWIGKAANRAAKLCSERGTSKSLFITKSIYDKLTQENRVSNGVAMWEAFTWSRYNTVAYRSSYRITDF